MKHSSSLRGPGLAVCLAAAIAVFTPALRAADIPTARVYVGDLDLRTQQGQRQAQQRVLRAIDKVCVEAETLATQTLRNRAAARKCREQAFARVQVQLEQNGLPRLPAHG
jgi:UrcA family protein